jgi:hypothetical protein
MTYIHDKNNRARDKNESTRMHQSASLQGDLFSFRWKTFGKLSTFALIFCPKFHFCYHHRRQHSSRRALSGSWIFLPDWIVRFLDLLSMSHGGHDDNC